VYSSLLLKEQEQEGIKWNNRCHGLSRLLITWKALHGAPHTDHQDKIINFSFGENYSTAISPPVQIAEDTLRNKSGKLKRITQAFALLSLAGINARSSAGRPENCAQDKTYARPRFLSPPKPLRRRFVQRAGAPASAQPPIGAHRKFRASRPRRVAGVSGYLGSFFSLLRRVGSFHQKRGQCLIVNDCCRCVTVYHHIDSSIFQAYVLIHLNRKIGIEFESSSPACWWRKNPVPQRPSKVTESRGAQPPRRRCMNSRLLSKRASP